MTPLTNFFRTDQWRGHAAFVVGSGPSRRELPDLLLSSLQRTIGVNEEYRWGPTVGLCQDVRFFFGDGSRPGSKDTPQWHSNPLGTVPVFFKGHPDRPDPEVDDLRIFTIGAAHKPEHSPQGTGLQWVWPKRLEEGLYYGACAGMAAFSLADVLGADPIFLVGFDCKSSDTGQSHWHDYYPKSWSLGNADEEHRKHVFARWVRLFKEIAPKIRASVYIVGDSALVDEGVFPPVEGAVPC